MSTNNHTSNNSRVSLTPEDLDQPEILFDVVQMLLGDVWQYLPDDLDEKDFAEESSVIYLIQSLCDQPALVPLHEAVVTKIRDALLALKESDYLSAFAYPHHMYQPA